MSTKKTTKFKITDVAKELKTTGADIVDSLGGFGIAKKTSQSIEEDELNLLLEVYTQRNGSENFDEYFASREKKPEAKAEPVKEAPAEPAEEKKPAKKAKKQEEQPAAEKPEEKPVVEEKKPFKYIYQRTKEKEKEKPEEKHIDKEEEKPKEEKPKEEKPKEETKIADYRRKQPRRIYRTKPDEAYQENIKGKEPSEVKKGGYAGKYYNKK